MKYDELSKIALSLAAKVLVKAVGVYDLTQLRDMQGVIIAEFLPILRAPEPVDDKGLAEAIKYTQYLSAQGGCEPAPWGPHKQLQLETVLAALRAARQEVAQLQEWKRQQLEVWSSWDVQAVGKLLGVPLGKSIHPAIAPGIESLQAEAKELRKDKERLSEALEKCFFHFGKEIKRMSLNESASTGTQAISLEIAQVLDKARAAGEGK